MSRIRPQCLDPEYSDRSARASVLLREEPDTEEDDEEDEEDKGNVKDDEATTMKRMTEATRCGHAVCVSDEG
jgi:hypothetical protein